MNLDQEIQYACRETESSINKVIIGLNDLIKLTEDKYAYVYETLPETEADIKSSMREVEILLDYLLYKDGVKENRQAVTVEALRRVQEEFEEVTDSFLNQELIETLMRTFLDDSGRDERSFSEMGRLVKEVRDTLADLRDLALNSMIFSIRVGQEGAGFQILADRINQISSSLGQEFSQMDKAMQDLDTWNQDFRQKLTEFVKYEETLQTKYKDKFQKDFVNISRVLRTICIFLNDHLENAGAVVGRFPEAMVLVQDQDIIRQNIENLIKCWDVVQQKKESILSGEREEILNYFVFVKKVGELSNLLLDNIENGLQNSIVALESVLIEINEQVLDLEMETQYLGAFFADAGTEVNLGYNVINEVFTRVMGQVVDLLYIKRHLEAKSEFLVQGRETFVNLMETVERDFLAIDREIRTLKKMRVLIKIELSRINQEDNNSMQSIVSAVDQVIETVQSNQIVFNQLRDHFIKNINDFNRAITVTVGRLAESGEVLELSKNKLSTAKNMVIGAVKAMVNEMGAIYLALKKPYKQIQVKDQVEEMILNTRQELLQYAEFVLSKEQELFDHFGVNEWEERQEDLKALLDQFTCYVERKSATEIFNEPDAPMEHDAVNVVLF